MRGEKLLWGAPLHGGWLELWGTSLPRVGGIAPVQLPVRSFDLCVRIVRYRLINVHAARRRRRVRLECRRPQRAVGSQMGNAH